MGYATLIRRNPHRAAPTRDLDRFFDDFWRGFGSAPQARALPHPIQNAPGFAPRVEAVELEDHYRLTAEIPGVEAADLDITIQEGVLTLRGERRLGGAPAPADVTVEAADGEAAEEAAAETAAVEDPRVERFERKFRFPADVVESEVKADYRNGVLTMTIPKPTVVEPQVRSIPIETR